MRRPGALLLFALAGLPVEAAAARQDPPQVRCTRCRHAGVRPCPEHEREDAELEGEALYCSAVAGCPVCGGTGWVDCSHCENRYAEERLLARRARVPAVAEEVAHYQEELGRELVLAVGPHFVLVWDVERLKVGKRWLASHELLHLYLGRLESFHDDYREVLGVSDDAFALRSVVLVWSTMLDHEAAALRYCNQSAPGGVKLMGIRPAYSVPYVRGYLEDEEELHRNLVHNSTHLLLSHQEPVHWIGITKGGWADEGLAHWFEDRVHGICDTYCYQEIDSSLPVQRGAWRPLVRKRVAREERVPFGDLFRRNTDTLERDEHPVAFSLVDYLIALDPASFAELLTLLKRKTETRDALRETWGLSPIELEEGWHAWVLDTYPAR